ncbi:Tubby-like F-box protein 3 [Vitis vinifera]|uniref:Tubby-like F-box protein 3 n=1 Tax=Vitis vinifera TaxID=29760 RepID=A0A438GNX9_VITVI|nr:Tubby-like F-box protein 3 [Vitis vinifera]
MLAIKYMEHWNEATLAHSIAKDKMHLYRLRLVVTLVTNAANNARDKSVKQCKVKCPDELSKMLVNLDVNYDLPLKYGHRQSLTMRCTCIKMGGHDVLAAEGAVFNWMCSEKDNILISKMKIILGFNNRGQVSFMIDLDKMHLYQLRLVVTLVTSVTNNAREKVMKACQMRQLENKMVDNHKDTMTKTRAMLHFEIVAAGERDVRSSMRAMQYEKPLPRLKKLLSILPTIWPRSNFWGTKFTVYNAQPPNVGARISESRLIRRLGSRQVSPRVPAWQLSYENKNLMTIVALPYVWGPRRMHCVMNSIPANAIEPG